MRRAIERGTTAWHGKRKPILTTSRFLYVIGPEKAEKAAEFRKAWTVITAVTYALLPWCKEGPAAVSTTVLSLLHANALPPAVKKASISSMTLHALQHLLDIYIYIYFIRTNDKPVFHRDIGYLRCLC